MKEEPLYMTYEDVKDSDLFSTTIDTAMSISPFAESWSLMLSGPNGQMVGIRVDEDGNLLIDSGFKVEGDLDVKGELVVMGETRVGFITCQYCGKRTRAQLLNCENCGGKPIG